VLMAEIEAAQALARVAELRVKLAAMKAKLSSA
jgi:hypothetical protein